MHASVCMCACICVCARAYVCVHVCMQSNVFMSSECKKAGHITSHTRQVQSVHTYTCAVLCFLYVPCIFLLCLHTQIHTHTYTLSHTQAVPVVGVEGEGVVGGADKSYLSCPWRDVVPAYVRPWRDVVPAYVRLWRDVVLA